MFVTLQEMDEVSFHVIGTSGFLINTEKEGFTAVSSHCRQNLSLENFTLSFDRLRQKICCAACATRLFFFVRPIRLFICDVIVAVAVS